MEQPERTVQRLEDWVGQGRKVKEKEKDEVVQVEVEMEEGKVNEEVEEKVVEEKVDVAGSWLTTFLGNRAVGAIMDIPWYLTVLAGPHAPGLNCPLLLPVKSLVWTLRFVMHHVHHKILGRGGGWVWVDQRGAYKHKPLRGGGGWFKGNGTSSPKCQGGQRAKRPPIPTKG